MFQWTVSGTFAGKGPASILPELVAILRFHELASITTPPRCGETPRRPPATAVAAVAAECRKPQREGVWCTESSELRKSNVPVSNWLAEGRGVEILRDRPVSTTTATRRDRLGHGRCSRF
ncbi:hypothetical protein [Rhodococcus koreensis]|uniref:hypothetical protein n=1 Tax=Rhodococcus koreensis TaxID=99653 RepID=UPI00197E6D94|nr:hypothetical protein [Rhodococcus koreensis]QSE86391.1 hypothetical protein JWS14_46210 [Rhodococcus koreensis]